MKRAETTQGQAILAGPNSPIRALCPECNWSVSLRSRGDRYFYRHDRGQPLTCPNRGRFLGREDPPSKVPAASYYRLEKGDRLYQILVAHGLFDVTHVIRSWCKKGDKLSAVRKGFTDRQEAEGVAQGHVLRMMRRGYDLVEWS